jgi:hypothetical protein
MASHVASPEIEISQILGFEESYISSNVALCIESSASILVAYSILLIIEVYVVCIMSGGRYVSPLNNSKLCKPCIRHHTEYTTLFISVILFVSRVELL